MLNDVKSVRDEALEAAYSRFRETGNVSMRQVGDAIDVSATALYYHFANKQALLGAVADRAFSAFEKRLRAIPPGDPTHIIRGILDEYRQFSADEPALFGLMFVAERPAARKFPADFAAHRSAVFNLLWKAVQECLESSGSADGVSDEISDESLHLAHDLWALTHGQILLWRAGRFIDERTFRTVLQRSIDRFIETL